MPNRDYKCDACGAVVERMLSNWRDAVGGEPELCPECKRGVLRKQLVTESAWLIGALRV